MELMSRPRIAIPVPTSFDAEYNQRTWPQYAQAIEQSGGEPVAIPLDDPAAADTAASCDAVLLPGSGADVDPAHFGEAPAPDTAAPDPKREAVDRRLLEIAERERKPVLAICFGAQSLNVWRGGSLTQHLAEEPVRHRQRNVIQAHSAEVDRDSLLAEAAGLGGIAGSENPSIPVNSSHHQAIAGVGAGLRIVARCPEDGIVEAIEGQRGDQFLLGVQWHPERTYEESPESRAIFGRFVAQAAAWRSRHTGTRQDG